MAKVKSIFSNISGRLGNITSYTIGGETYIRSLPDTYRDAKSPAQVLQRKKMIELGRLYREFKSVMRFPNKAKWENNASLFFKFNKNNFSNVNDNLDFNFSEIILTNSGLPNLVNLKMRFENTQQYIISWDIDRNQSNLIVVSWVYCKDSRQVYSSFTPVIASQSVLSIPDSYTGGIWSSAFLVRG
jgi:hypothetical protein